MKQAKEKKKRFEALKNWFYAVAVITRAAPMAIASQTVAMVAYWFFTAFVQEILFLKMLLQIIEEGRGYGEFLTLLLIFVAAGVLSKALDCAGDYVGSLQFKRAYKKLNERIFKKACQVDIDCFENPEFYNKYKRATEVISDEHYSDFVYYTAQLFSGAFTGVFLVSYIVSLDPRILLVLLSMAAVVAVQAVKSRLEIKKDKEMTVNKRQKAYVQRLVFLREYAKDMRTSGIFSVMRRRFAQAIENNREIIKKYGYKIALLELCSGIFSESFPVAATYLYAAYRFVIKRNLKMSDFSVLMTAVSNVKDVLNDIGDAVTWIQKESLYFGNLREFLEYEPTVIGGDRQADELESLEFCGVSFTYPGAEKPSVDNMSFCINKGETVAVVGKNGAGKTTFVKLLLRFYDPDGGVILYNGVDLREYDIASLRQRMATVFQDYKVFALSVNENVLCRECLTEEDSAAALGAIRSSGVYDKIMSLPEGAQTVLTREFDSRGTGLSGGEKQKVAAARMFARDFDLAVLDEPSSALDPIAEYKMYESLIEATKGKTVIYISHRLSSAVLSDRVFVIDGGCVAQSGTHRELMERGGIYAEMFSMQASSYTDAGEVPEL